LAGQRREQRKKVQLAVRVFGTDAEGRPFSESLTTVDISREGVRVDGIKSRLQAGEIVGVTYGKLKGRFRVKWIGQPGTAGAGQLGLQNVAPENCIWDVPLPAPGPDNYARNTTQERRIQPRMKCNLSLELFPIGEEARIWAKAADISLGGCFVEMPMPLKKGTKVKLALSFNDAKIVAHGVVSNSRPGFGFGIAFNEVAEEDRAKLQEFVRSLRHLPL